MTDRAWQEYRRTLAAAVTDAARARLLDMYTPMLKDRLELGRHAGVLPRSEEPVYRWARYKEAYSPQLVRQVLDELVPAQGRAEDQRAQVIYDPMVGSGTSLLVAAERGLPAIGADLLPYATFLTSTLARALQADSTCVQEVGEEVLARYTVLRGRRVPDVPASRWAFAPAVARTLTQVLQAVDKAPAGVARELVRLAVLSAVEQVSYAVKDGTSLRRRLPDGPARPGRPGQQRRRMDSSAVAAAVRTRVTEMVTDLETLRERTGNSRSGDDGGTVRAPGMERLSTDRAADGACGRTDDVARGGSLVVRADAREWRPTSGSCAVAVFSPPYPNRYDYSAVYQLELALGRFVTDGSDLRSVRRQLLRSHLEAPPRSSYGLELPPLREFLAAVNASRASGDQAGRVLRMVAGFFEDMAEVLARIFEALRPGGSAAIVVGTQTYYGHHLPTDLLLAELASASGFDVRALWVVRAKGVASQQRSLTSAPSRESVLLLDKPR